MLSQPALAKRRAPVLLACNKQDLGSKAHSVDFIRKRLEKELDQVGLGRADGGGGWAARHTAATSAGCDGEGVGPGGSGDTVSGANSRIACSGASWQLGGWDRRGCGRLRGKGGMPLLPTETCPLAHKPPSLPPLSSFTAAAQHARRAQRCGRRQRQRRAAGRAWRAFHF